MVRSRHPLKAGMRRFPPSRSSTQVRGAPAGLWTVSRVPAWPLLFRAAWPGLILVCAVLSACFVCAAFAWPLLCRATFLGLVVWRECSWFARPCLTLVFCVGSVLVRAALLTWALCWDGRFEWRLFFGVDYVPTRLQCSILVTLMWVLRTPVGLGMRA